jgi:hypothetical protein
VPPHCHYDAPWPAESECAHGAFPPAGHQNLAETLHIRKSASRDPAAVAPRTQTFGVSWAIGEGRGAMDHDDFRFRHYC